MSDIAEARAAEKRARERADAAYQAWVDAKTAHTEASRARRDAEEIVAPAFDTLTTEQLREHVADMARAHGAWCSREGRVETSAAWLAFRKALRALAERAP